MATYPPLVAATLAVQDAPLAERLLDQAGQAGKFSSKFRRLEHAYKLLAQGEVARARNDFRAARVYFAEACVGFDEMEVQWGMARARIGMALCGGKPKPERLVGLQGLDRLWWARFRRGDAFAPGALVHNLP